MYTASGNGASGVGDPYDGSDSVLEFDGNAHLISRFSPSNWAAENDADQDLGSQGPALVGKWVFQAGKSGTAYVLKRDALGGIGHQVSSASLCQSFGGTAVSGSVVYVPCTNGLRKVSIDASGVMHTQWTAAPTSVTGAPVIARRPDLGAQHCRWRAVRPQPGHRGGCRQRGRSRRRHPLRNPRAVRRADLHPNTHGPEHLRDVVRRRPGRRLLRPQAASAPPVGSALVRVLVIGSGAREHALCLALAADPAVTALVCAPGNAGTAAVAEQRGVAADDGAAVAALAADVHADLVVIGPEAPLVAGVADAVRAAGIACFGPSREAAQLEGSKAFAKSVMHDAGVPTASARLCRHRGRGSCRP